VLCFLCGTDVIYKYDTHELRLQRDDKWCKSYLHGLLTSFSVVKDVRCKKWPTGAGTAHRGLKKLIDSWVTPWKGDDVDMILWGIR
jgi:hypothetical protein